MRPRSPTPFAICREVWSCAPRADGFSSPPVTPTRGHRSPTHQVVLVLSEAVLVLVIDVSPGFWAQPNAGEPDASAWRLMGRIAPQDISAAGCYEAEPRNERLSGEDDEWLRLPGMDSNHE